MDPWGLSTRLNHGEAPEQLDSNHWRDKGLSGPPELDLQPLFLVRNDADVELIVSDDGYRLVGWYTGLGRLAPLCGCFTAAGIRHGDWIRVGD